MLASSKMAEKMKKLELAKIKRWTKSTNHSLPRWWWPHVVEFSHIIIVWLKNNKRKRHRHRHTQKWDCQTLAIALESSYNYNNWKGRRLTPFKKTSLRTPENRLLGIRLVKLNASTTLPDHKMNNVNTSYLSTSWYLGSFKYPVQNQVALYILLTTRWQHYLKQPQAPSPQACHSVLVV